MKAIKYNAKRRRLHDLSRKLPKWLDFAELPAYLRDELVAMDEKQKKMPSIPTLNSVQLVCVD